MVGVILATLSDANENCHGEQLWADFIFRNILDASQFSVRKLNAEDFRAPKTNFLIANITIYDIPVRNNFVG